MFLDCPPPVRKQAAEDPTQYTVPRIATRVTTRRGLASVIWRTSSLFYKQQGVLTLDTRPLGHHDNHHTHNTQTRVHLSCLARTQSHTLHMCMTHLTRVEAADDLQPSSRSAALPDRGPWPVPPRTPCCGPGAEEYTGCLAMASIRRRSGSRDAGISRFAASGSR